MKQLVAKEMGTAVEEVLDDGLRKLFHVTQSGARFVVYKVVERLMLNLVQNMSLKKR